MHGHLGMEQGQRIMGARRELEAGCFVIDQPDLVLQSQGSLHWVQVIGSNDESQALSLFYAEAGPGRSPVIFQHDAEAVLYLQDGHCTVSICDNSFDVDAGTGIHVRAGENFHFINERNELCKWLISICPGQQGLSFTGASTAVFNSSFPQRTVSSEKSRSNATGDRFYKLLVGPQTGSEMVTQFIGRIPHSKAPEHFHLYEEAICILSGHGRMWNGKQHTDVRPGSMIFLPRKQPHCLECMDENGMELMGVFYPSGSPAINYATGSE